MSVRPAIIFSICLAILLPIYFFVDQPSVRHMQQLKVEHAHLLNLTSVTAITLKRGTEIVTYRRLPGASRWDLVAPANAFVPQDLMTALAGLLTTQKAVEVVADNTDDLGNFGLDDPHLEMTVISPNQPQPVKIFFGNENPPHTAIYAMIQGINKVFLLGRNLEYYQNLMFQWVEGKQGKKS